MMCHRGDSIRKGLFLKKHPFESPHDVFTKTIFYPFCISILTVPTKRNQPVEVVMSSGERHLVKHPEFAILMPSRVIVTDPVADRAAILSLMHVTELRPVQPQASN